MEIKRYIEIIKLIFASFEIDSDELATLCTKLEKKFEELHELGLQDSFLDFLRQEYGDDIEIYKTLLRYIVNSIDEKTTKYELLTILLKEELEGEANIFFLWEIKKQLQITAFLMGKRPKIQEDFQLYQYMSQKMRSTLAMNYSKMPLSERDKDCIVFTTTQLLSVRHAPTKVILEFARILTSRLNKRVVFVNTLKMMDKKACERIGLGTFGEYNYTPELNGTNLYTYKEETFELHQLEISLDKIEEVRKLVEYIYRLHPLCVWNFGGVPTFANALQQFTTLIHTELNQGYPGVPSDIIVNYFAGSPVENKVERTFIEEQGVKVHDIRIGLQYPEFQGEMTRKDFDIPENAFCISLVGNRLPSECSEYFLHQIARVWENEPDIFVVFIGPTRVEFEEKVKREMGNITHIRFLGGQKKLQSAIGMMDIFVNPPRLGGGTGAILAMLEGKPIITLAGCDVASIVGDDFFCECVEKFPEEMLRYRRDLAYYEKQSKAAKEKSKEYVKTDEEHAQILQGVLDLIE